MARTPKPCLLLLMSKESGYHRRSVYAVHVRQSGSDIRVQPSTSAPSTSDLKSAPTPRSRKSRTVASRRTVPRHRKTPSRPGGSLSHYYGQTSSSYTSRSPIPAQFNFASGSRSSPKPAEDADVDDQMDWMGDRLAQLIAEGQKALGKEVVVMSEDQADEVDDGSGAWVEEEDERAPGSSHRSGFGLPPYSPHTPQLSGSPKKARFARGASVDSETRSIASLREDENTWDSPEMRESMERARMLYRQKRGL